jgi:hypothetical protein
MGLARASVEMALEMLPTCMACPTGLWLCARMHERVRRAPSTSNYISP